MVDIAGAFRRVQAHKVKLFSISTVHSDELVIPKSLSPDQLLFEFLEALFGLLSFGLVLLVRVRFLHVFSSQTGQPVIIFLPR